MKIKDILTGALIRAPAKVKNCAEDEEERGWTSLGSRRKATREIALKSASYYSCMKIRCEALAKLPLKIMQDTDKGTIPRKDHPLWGLLSLRPNRFTSAYDFLWATEFQRLDTGNAFWDRKGSLSAGLQRMLLRKVRSVKHMDGAEYCGQTG